MSALRNELNAKTQSAQLSHAKAVKKEQAEQRAKHEKEAAQGVADALKRVPQIKQDLDAAAEQGEKSLKVNICGHGDRSELSCRHNAEQAKLVDYFSKKGLLVKTDYDYDSGSGDSFYGGPHYEHFLVLSW